MAAAVSLPAGVSVLLPARAPVPMRPGYPSRILSVQQRAHSPRRADYTTERSAVKVEIYRPNLGKNRPN